MNEPVKLSGVFVKPLAESNQSGKSNLLFVAKKIAWFPEWNADTNIPFGQAMLGSLGADVGLLDRITHRRPLLADENEAFYSIMAAASSVPPNQLLRAAEGNLAPWQQHWQNQLKSLPKPTKGKPLTKPERQRRLLAKEALTKAAEGRFSIAPFFNVPEEQVGQLIVLRGTVHRAVRVEVAAGALLSENQTSKPSTPHGIDHYYELDLFTADSQNLPIIVCVRNLPAGFPEGSSVYKPVQVAGFFFKSWLYHTRKPITTGDRRGDKMQLAPLFIGNSPIHLVDDSRAISVWVGPLIGGSFVVLLAWIWFIVWRQSLGNRQVDKRYRGISEDFPEGEMPQEMSEEFETLFDFEGQNSTEPLSATDVGELQ